jgi:acetolactate decarboxylase
MSASRSPEERIRRMAGSLVAHRSSSGAGPHGTAGAREVYQSSTMAALLNGIYDGDVSIDRLLEHGDFGLGTFNRLDGEMVVLDGTCYRLRSDGTARVAAPTDLTPFAAVTWFRTSDAIAVAAETGRTELIARIDRAIPSGNLLYGIRVTGEFSRVRTRTVAAQSQPYPPLAEATEGQVETSFSDVSGTLAGFRTPQYEQGISVAGYHLHFIDDARERGGHALDFRLRRGEVEISVASEMHLSLPTSGPFLASDLTSGATDSDIHRAEG